MPEFFKDIQQGKGVALNPSSSCKDFPQSNSSGRTTVINWAHHGTGGESGLFRMVPQCLMAGVYMIDTAEQPCPCDSFDYTFQAGGQYGDSAIRF